MRGLVNCDANITSSELPQRYTYRVLQTIQIKLILVLSGQSGPFWAALKLLKKFNMKHK